MKYVNIQELYKVIQKKRICIFGAGKAGSAIFSYLKMHNCRHLYVADNDMGKHGTIDGEYEIGTFEKSVEMKTDIYLVGFINNDTEKLKSVIDFLYDRGVPAEKIECIDFRSNWVNEFSAEYTESEYKRINWNVKERKSISRIVLLGNLYNEDSKKRVGGGTTGAVNMQRILLGEQFEGLDIECLMFPKTWETGFAEKFNKYDYILFAIRFLFSDVQKNDAVYLSNDIFTACALARYGQKYIFLYHGQGDFVSDMNAFGAQLNEREKKFITYVEKEAVKYSYKTFFPSKGARIHFLNTIDGKIDFEENPPLYNSIYDFPSENYRNHKNNGELVFFSVGQMTRLKGMDQIPDFLNRVRMCTGKKIYWIVVANGELKNDVKNRIATINKTLPEHIRIDCTIIDYVIDHQKIYQLMAESDIYIMLHRISIFDFSTLEAMYMKKPIILSDVVGNDEFNCDNNILLVSENTSNTEIKTFIAHKKDYGISNRKVYDLFFSGDAFRKRYYRVFRELIYDEIENVNK